MNNKNNTSNDLAKKLKEYRLDRDFTFRQMAALIKIDRAALWRIENGHTKPNERTLRKIMRAIPQLAEVA